MARRIESHFIAGPAGRLEALLEEPEMAPAEACVVCHPHPLYGGTMHNKVVHRLARGLRRSGSVVLRFNFRGVSRSQGEHAHGIGEVEDARAALEWLRARYPQLPQALAGFSFGSRVALSLGCRAGVRRIIAAGFPAGDPRTGDVGACPVPKHFIQSTNDQHGPKPQMEAFFAKIPEPKSLHWIQADDHFFAGGLDRLEDVVLELQR